MSLETDTNELIIAEFNGTIEKLWYKLGEVRGYIKI